MLNSLDINTGLILKLNMKRGVHYGALSNMKIAVKDLFHIKGIPTYAGNPDWLLTHEIPQNTASAVETLLENGATVIGKSLTDELAYSLNGSNIHFGTPINHKAQDRLPGGSTSGSAVAVASGCADIGLGTDTGGSIRVPASYNGLFGLRPTHGEVAMDNMVPLAPSFDTVGWLTRDIDTLRLTAEVLLPLQKVKKTLEQLVILKPVINHHVIWHTDIDAWLTERSHHFKTVKEIKFDESFYKKASQAFRTLQGAEIWQTHGAWIESISPTFSPDIQARFEWCKTITDQNVLDAKIIQAEVIETLNKVLIDDSTVLLLPTTPGAAPLIESSSEFMDEYRIQLMGLTALAGLSGRPQLHLPVLEKESAPWGLSLIGAKHSDLALIHLAKQIIGTK